MLLSRRTIDGIAWARTSWRPFERWDPAIYVYMFFFVDQAGRILGHRLWRRLAVARAGVDDGLMETK